VDAASSSCGKSDISFAVDFGDNERLIFSVSSDKGNFFISSLKVEANDIHGQRDNLTQFSTPLGRYYKCSVTSEVDLQQNDVRVVFSEMKFQAFKPDHEFTGTELECVSDYHSDVVIIAIGCALALLVVVVLVAYLIARKRSRQRGYQSV